MRKASKLLVLIVGLAFMLTVSFLYALFNGYLDHGKFEVKQFQWSPTKQVAMVVERSDQQALSGYTYFVLIGDHVFSSSEIRHAYHSSAVVFAAADSCVDLHWQGPDALSIGCRVHRMTREHIDVAKNESGGIAIFYDNIPVTPK